ncbi:MAG: RyR domain-containing protein [Hyphomonadaceae bacterium]
MAETEAGVSGRPATRKSNFLIAITALASMFGVAALALAAYGWTFEPEVTQGPLYMRLTDITVRTIKVLLLSDIYFEPIEYIEKWPLESARALGVASSLLFGLRLLLYAIGSHLHAIWFRVRSNDHDVIIGSGPAALEYAGNHSALFDKRRAIHLAAERAPTAKRLATYARSGTLDNQLRFAAARRAKRILVDEGDDADTWQTAQAIAGRCRKAEVLAHITDPWMRDRLSREAPTARLTAFSYAGGAAREVMLAHPPYLIAEKLETPAQHILIVGFGQVGQSIAREFIVTSISPLFPKMMVTVVDPLAGRLEADFRNRHPDLCTPKHGAGADDGTHVDFGFCEGDFRFNDDKLFAFIRERSQACEVSAVYIAIDLERRPLGLALALRAMAAQERLFRAPVFVCAQHGAGLSAVRDGAGYVGGAMAPTDRIALERLAEQDGRICDLRVISFGSWPEAFDGAGLLEGELDGQAKRFHNEYERQRAEESRRKDPAAPPPEPQPWDVLPDQLRVSNRRVAAHIRAKAHASGYDLGAWLDSKKGGWAAHDLPPAAELIPNEPDDKLSGEAADRMRMLGELEHRRWMLDRYLDGWRKGERDDYARRRPDLIPFAELSEPSKKKDYTVIRVTHALLEGKAPGGRRRV